MNVKNPKIKKLLSEKDLLFFRLPGVIHTTACLNLCFEYFQRKFGGAPYGLFFFSIEKGEKGLWVIDRNEYLRNAKRIFNNQAFFQKIYKQNLKECDNFFNSVSDLEKKGIPSSLNDLKKAYESFIDSYLSAYSTLMFPANVTYSLADEIVTDLTKKYKYNFAGKIVSKFPTSAERYQLSLLRIKRRAGKKSLINDHVKRFYWIRTNYFSNYQLRTSEVAREIIEARKQKREKINFSFLSKEDKEKVERLELVSYWHDVRKHVNQVANFWIFRFLEQASKIIKVPLIELKYSTPKEFVNMLGGQKVSDLKRRVEASAIFTDCYGNEDIFTGKEVKKLWQKYEFKEKVNEVFGTAAQSGVIQGRAKIILNVKKDKLSKGEILITSTTRPEFMPIIKKASAIVADEGGITSHAAVISREFGIPCIVGTKKATKVFKDGDIVEVIC